MSEFEVKAEAPEIIIPSKKNIILDATVLTSLMNCPRLTDYRYNYNFKPIGGKSNSLECGSLVHHILEAYYKGIRSGLDKVSAIEKGFERGKKYIKEGDDGSGLINTPAESTKKPKRIGWEWVLKTMEQYFEFYKNEYWEPVDVEFVKGAVIYEDSEIRILWKAKFDLTTDTLQGIYPVDHKTAQMNRDPVSLNNQFMGQCLLQNTTGMIVNKIGFQESLEPKEKFLRPMINYTSDRLAEWATVIVPYWAKQLIIYAEDGYWPPNFTSCDTLYGGCSFKEVCEANRNMRQEELKMKFYVGEPWDVSNTVND